MSKQKEPLNEEDKKNEEKTTIKKEEEKKDEKVKESWIGKHSMKGMPPQGIPEGERL